MDYTYTMHPPKKIKKIHSILLLIAFLFIISDIKATTYYFSTSIGDDSRNSRQAQNLATPWKTIEKLNSFFYKLKAGDSVLFRRNEIFYGSIDVKKSGSPAAFIVIGAYGKGNEPVIYGLSTVSSWMPLAKGIYQSTCRSCKPEGKMLIINGVQQALGRYPNKGYLIFQSHTGNTSITDKHLSALPNWTSADIIIKKNHWLIDRSTITLQTGTTLNYTGGSPNKPIDGFGYFIDNDPRTLDQFGEWYFSPADNNIQVFFGDENPGSYQVNVSTENTLVNIHGYSFIKFENLAFRGAGKTALQITNSRNIIIQHCNIDLSGADGIDGTGSPYMRVENSVINHSLNDAINLDSGCISSSIRNNLIKNTGLIPGMGKSGPGTYQAVSAFGDSTLVELNEIDSSGYNAIYFGGNAATVKNNFIQYFCLIKDDGAGIYVGDWFPSSGKKIIGNIILNGSALHEGTNNRGLPFVEGIYIDDNTAGVDIVANSVANCPDAGIKIHNAKDVKLRTNMVFNNSTQLLIAHDNISPNSPVRNVKASGNIFFCKRADQLCLNIYSVDNDIDSFGSMDSNYYYRPADDNIVIQTTSDIWTPRSITKKLSLVEWQGVFKKDLTSKKNFIQIKDANEIGFEYNPSPITRKISLKGYYIDADRIIHADKFMLQPYRTALIVKDKR